MAFVSDPNAQDPTQGQNPNANPLSQQAPITSAPSAGAGKAAVSPSNSAPTQPFTNLQSYLSANAPQIQQEGQQIAGGLNTQYGQVQNDINAGANTFNQNVKAGYTPLDQATLDAFNTSPTAVAANPDQAKSFTGMYGDSYTGPANFETSNTYGNLTGEVQNAVSNAQSLQTPQGISSYFSSTAPNYTQGMGTLDAALLQGNPDVATNIRAATQPFANLPGYLTSAVTSADQGVQNVIAQSQAAKAAAQNEVQGQNTALTNRVSAEQQALQDAYAKRVADSQAFYNQFNAPVNTIPQIAWQGNNVDPRLIEAIGAMGTFDTLNPNASVPLPIGTTYVKQNPLVPPSQSDAISSNDVALSNALALLSGGAVNPGYTQAGNYKLANMPTFDQSQLGQDMYSLVSNMTPGTSWTAPNAMSTYNDALANLQAYLGLPVTPVYASPVPPPPSSPPPSSDTGGGYHPVGI
jgi:hypothetical protein